jgi:TetR/AcrR family transcriptional regulator, fatty acid metabolism regulator protein
MTTTQAARSLRERQRQEREDLILQAAEELFLEKGSYDASIDDIAARVGIAKGTVYLHFASKEDLVFALLQRDVRQLLDEVDGILALSESATARLRAIMERVYSGMLGSYFQMLAAAFQNPEFRARMAEKHTVMR